ncbi:ATP-binding protein [Geomesophilobacter sediminis]|uniref:histidine kinase n=1 Tax=Geomesophilobacter sediminis TaxID=2798584 RepID=A0A8J7M1E9_9BACT|nr:ATP-binding protein [Geomesophilobacter sediminis]MBJ6726874.1 PAS domain S-box protein [Geomesophilobacter sediminis]
MLNILSSAMTRFFSLTIRAQLVFIVLITAVPAGGMILYSGMKLRSEAIKIAVLDSQRLADSMALQQKNLVAAAQQLVSALAQLPAVKRGDPANVEPLLAEILRLNSHYSNIAIINPDGLVLASAVKALRNRSVADRRYFKNPIAAGRFSSGEYIISRAIFKPVFNFGYPLRDERGEIIGVLSLGFDLGPYEKAFADAKLPAGSNFLIIDHSGVILSGAADAIRFVGKRLDPRLFDEMKNGPEEGHGLSRFLGDGTYYVAYRKMRLAGEEAPYMYIRVGIPTAAVLANANKILWSNLALLMPGLIVALYIALLIANRSIADRILVLKKASQHLADGGLDAPISGLVAGGELGSLGESFDNLAKELALGEEARRASEMKYQMIFDASKDAIILHDRESGRILDANDTVQQMYGYSKAEILSLTVQDLGVASAPIPWLTAGEGETSRNLADAASFEWECRRKGGEPVWTEVLISPTSIGGEACFLAVVRDITERLEAETEKKQLKDQLHQIQRMESIGRLAGGMAHDLNNLLTPIMVYTELLKMDFIAERGGVDMADQILLAANRARILVQQLLSFGRKQMLDIKVVDLNQVISSFYDILRRTIRENIEIQWKPSDQIHNIRADVNQIEQIMMNLAVNAQDAISGKGTITIETALMVLDQAYARHHTSVKPGRYMMFAVTDDGCGMDTQTMEQVFEPFFTTKPVGQGSGLGLATVYGLVKQHGGSIWVYSEPGKGTSFKVFFPVVDDEVSAERAEPCGEVVFAAVSHSILLVEDNEMLRVMTANLLSTRGLNVTQADGPQQALELARGRTFDMLITDVVMPDLSGPELHQQLLEDHPDLIVLFMSGYTRTVVDNQGFLGDRRNFIQKPFAVNDFLAKVKELLYANPGG